MVDGTVKQVVGRPLQSERITLQHVGSRGNREREFCILFYHKDCHTEGIHFNYFVQNLLHKLRREVLCWLLHTDQPGPTDERAGKGQHLQFAAMQCACSLVAPICQTWEDSKNPLHIVAYSSSSPTYIGSQAKILLDGEIG